MTTRSQAIGMVACAFEVGATPVTEVQLLPAGEFRAEDGRPRDAAAWRLDAEIAALVIKRGARRVNRRVIDYEHQTLNTEWNGQPAPAAGWFSGLQWRDGEGLFATGVQWTPKATAAIDAAEYRYISAVFSYLPESGEVLDVLNAGLTNAPAIDGMSEVVARAAARRTLHDPQPPLENDVDKALKEALDLTEGAGIDDAVAAIAALRTQIDTAQAAVAAAKAATATPDPAKYAPVTVVEELRTEIAALRAESTGREVDTLVAAALADGRLLPAQEGWARELGTTNLAALTSYVESAQPIAALRSSQSGGADPDTGEGADGLNAQQTAICRAMGLDSKTYKAGLAAA